MTDENQNSKEALIKTSPEYYSTLSEKYTHSNMDRQNSLRKKIKYTTKQWLTLITLAFGNFCAGACVSLQAPFFPSEAELKGATPTEYGFIFGIFQLTIFIVAPIMGKLCRGRFGRIRQWQLSDIQVLFLTFVAGVPYVSPKILLNCGIFTVGSTCVAFGTLDLIDDRTTFVAMAFAIRTVEGVGAAAMRTSCYTIIASQFDEGIGTTFAILETFLGIGLITGPTLGGALYDLGGYGLPFYVIGSIVIIDAIIILFALPKVEKTKMPEKGNLLRFWMQPTVLIYSLSVFTSFNFIGFNQATLEPHIREFGLSGLFLGMMFALSGTIYAVTAPGWGWLCDKQCNIRFLSLIGCFINIAALLLIGPAPFFKLKPNLTIVITSLVLLGFGLGAKLVCAFVGTLRDTMEKGFPPDICTYGLISSMIASSQSLGAFVGPSLGGYLVDEFGFRNASLALLVLEVVLVILLLCSLFIKISNSKVISQPPEVKENILSYGAVESFQRRCSQ